MSTIDTKYIDLCRDILANGSEKGDRTGTGTLSLFGAEIRHDLSESFPLLTTKRMFVRGVIGELLWFISGSTDVNDLNDMGIKFWDSWKGDDGTIGSGYGKQMRNIEHIAAVIPKLYSPEENTIPVDERTVFGVGTLGNYDKTLPLCNELQSVWRDMMRRCYYDKSQSYKHYGAKGVHVSSRWMTFANFLEDMPKVVGWNLKLEHAEDYTLDKDVLYASNRYSVETCMWCTHEVQSANTSTNRYFKAISPEGKEKVFTSTGEANREDGLNISAVHRCLNGKLKKHHGWTEFTYLESSDGSVFRYIKKDQLKEVIASIKHDPDSRRHLITLWNPHEVDRTTLPPCHGVAIQFYVDKGKLSCLMVQRSGDIFLGVPVNIASYALMTHMIAQICNLGVGELIWRGGDVHIYKNHIEQVKTQIERYDNGEVFEAPTLVLNKDITDIDDFTFDDIQLINYKNAGKLTGEVAV